MSDFILRYPNQFDEREAPLFAQFQAECDAIRNRGPIDVQALINGTIDENTPGLGSVIPVTEDMIAYYAEKYNPENPLYNDADYAKKAGFEGIPAILSYGAHDDTYLAPVPREARDVMLIAGLNHEITSCRPIYAGDTLFMVVDDRHFTDLTPPEGSYYRTIAIYCGGTVYNQKGEIVSKVAFRVRENLKTYIPEKRPQPDPNDPMGGFGWEGPPWTDREDHYYTDEDWAKIKEIWANEKIRGAEVLYWEDVNIGDEPTVTLDGPIDDSLEPVHSWGPGLGGSRSLKKEIMDPEVFKTMKRNPHDGIYRLDKRSDSFPDFPAWAFGISRECGHDFSKFPEYIASHPGVSDKFKMHTSFQDNDDPMCESPERMIMINFYGRDFAIRHFTNWMGDKGVIRNIKWGIMPDLCMKEYGYDLPANPEATDFLAPYPEMHGKCLHHPMERDAYITRSRVFNKRVENGEHLVDFVWWQESITGDVFEEGQCTIALPSREG